MAKESNIITNLKSVRESTGMTSRFDLIWHAMRQFTENNRHPAEMVSNIVFNLKQKTFELVL